MPGLYEIRFLPDGPVTRFAGSRGNYYEFADGSRLDLHTTPVWCRRCGQVTHGEKIETLEQIDREIADLQDPGTYAHQMWTEGVVNETLGGGDERRQSYIEEVRKRRWWRAGRSSPPKCIRCGSADIFVFPVDEPCPNPAGPGTAEVRMIGMCSTDFNEWFFTPEGDRLPRDATPTYWHHPHLDNSRRGLRRWLKRWFGRGRGPGRKG